MLMIVPVLLLRLFEGSAWDSEDFGFLAAMLGLLVIAWEAALRLKGNAAYAMAAGLALLLLLMTFWVNLAVGIVGSEDDPVNLAFFAVPAVAAVAIVWARWRAALMARAMVIAAIAQGLVFLALLVTGNGFTGPITIFFAALWLIAGWLFYKAAAMA